MKRIISFFMALVMSFMFFGCGQKQAPDAPGVQDKYIEKIKQSGVFRVGVVLDGQMPMTFASEDFSVQGFDKDLSEKLKEKIFGNDLRIQFVPVTEDNKAEFFKNDKADIILDRSVSVEDADVIYSENYIKDKLVMVSKEEYKKEDLENLKAGALNRGEAIKFCQKNKINSLVTFVEYVDLLGALDDKMVDCVVMSGLTYKYFLLNGLEDTVSFDIGEEELYAICMPKEAEGLKKAVDSALEEFFNDKSMEDMANKWFGRSDCLVR